jgi:hypothetical protein
VATEKKNGMSLPAGLYQSTSAAQPEPPKSTPKAVVEQGGEPEADLDTEPTPAKPSRARKKKPAATGADKDGWKLYLSEDVRFRLRMLAFKRGAKLSTVANEVLDKALPRWNLERTD